MCVNLFIILLFDIMLSNLQILFGYVWRLATRGWQYQSSTSEHQRRSLNRRKRFFSHHYLGAINLVDCLNIIHKIISITLEGDRGRGGVSATESKYFQSNKNLMEMMFFSQRLFTLNFVYHSCERAAIDVCGCVWCLRLIAMSGDSQIENKNQNKYVIKIIMKEIKEPINLFLLSLIGTTIKNGFSCLPTQITNLMKNGSNLPFIGSMH